MARIFLDSVDHDISGFRLEGVHVEPTAGFSYIPCDLAVLYGVPNPLTGFRPNIALRNDVYRKHDGPILAIESSIIGRRFRPKPLSRLHQLVGRYRKPVHIHPHFRLAVGGAFGPNADFNNKNRPPDRWNKLGISIQPYRTGGEHVLLLGQTPGDASLRGVLMRDWLLATARQLRCLVSRPIRIRLHPNMSGPDAAALGRDVGQISDVSISPRTNTLATDLQSAWATVSLSSGAAIDSLIAGIPALTLSEDSLAYAVTSHDLTAIADPPMFAREQWLYDLAYAQWSLDEFADGTAWSHIAPAVYRALPVHIRGQAAPAT